MGIHNIKKKSKNKRKNEQIQYQSWRLKPVVSVINRKSKKKEKKKEKKNEKSSETTNKVIGNMNKTLTNFINWPAMNSIPQNYKKKCVLFKHTWPICQHRNMFSHKES